MKFKELNIDGRIQDALEKLGYSEATEVQSAVIPELKQERDVIVKAKTGSGKTAAFAIPLLDSVVWEENKPQVLVLTPTRELAIQVKEDFDNIGTYKKIKTLAIFGKQPYKFQTQDLKQKTHVVVATPGRILDHLQRGTFDASHLKYLVLDEADEMLNMGFIETVEKIIEKLPVKRTTCLFSATLPEEIQKLAAKFMKNPVQVNIKQSQVINQKIETYAYEVMSYEKAGFLLKLIVHEKPSSAIIFCETQERVNEVYDMLYKNGISVHKIHGGMLQTDRLENMNDFRLGKVQFLVATDVAARGIDIENISHVINYDLPREAQNYIHRIGRTARIGKAGIAISLLSKDDYKRRMCIEDYTETSFDIKDNESIFNTVVNCQSLNELKKMVVQKEKKNKVLQEDIMRLYFSVGKRKKIAAGNLVGAICALEDVNGDDIGIIQVQDMCSYVDILNGKGKSVAQRLNNTLIKGRTMKVEIANRKM